VIAQRLGAGQLDGLAERLAQVPAPERPLTAAEALTRLLPALRKMQARGHTLDTIRSALAAEGLQVSVRALRTVFSKPKGVVAARRQPAKADAGTPTSPTSSAASRARSRPVDVHANAPAKDAME
jgi:hypothetical protein